MIFPQSPNITVAQTWPYLNHYIYAITTILSHAIVAIHRYCTDHRKTLVVNIILWCRILWYWRSRLAMGLEKNSSHNILQTQTMGNKYDPTVVFKEQWWLIIVLKTISTQSQCVYCVYLEAVKAVKWGERKGKQRLNFQSFIDANPGNMVLTLPCHKDSLGQPIKFVRLF